ncbi:MAG: TIGR04282 family arsenosugar biosynthesis glycosyltransferase [Deltaproteobacteria bacterium]|nr:TIGR04282 family arsenosugar biosynthesis glycosyltransferase [Deltaproteobacteria bacterium]
MNPANQLVMLVKYPVPGKTKTRLTPHLTSQQAALVHREISERVLSSVLKSKVRVPFELEIHYEGGDLDLMKGWLGALETYTPQSTGDLGERITSLLKRHYRTPDKRIVLIGSDCPFLEHELLALAFDSLKTTSLVIGPAFDGGYYLIGTDGFYPELFEDIPWGSERVYWETLKRATLLGLKAKILKPLHDIDRPEDLRLWEELKSEKSL